MKVDAQMLVKLKLEPWEKSDGRYYFEAEAVIVIGARVFWTASAIVCEPTRGIVAFWEPSTGWTEELPAGLLDLVDEFELGDALLLLATEQAHPGIKFLDVEYGNA